MIEFFLGSLLGVFLTSVFCYLKFTDKDQEDVEEIPLYIPSKLYWNKTRNSIEEYTSRLKSGFGDLIIILRGYGYERVSDSVDKRSEVNYDEKVWVWSVKIGDEVIKRERLNSEDSLMTASEAKEKTFDDVLNNLTN